MHGKEAENFVKMMKIKFTIDHYKEKYGKDWRQVYEEDKANNCVEKEE